MKKTLGILLSLLMLMTLIGCSEKKAPEDPNAKYYGRYETIRLESMDDRFTQDIMYVVLEQMQQEKTLFYFDLGEKSYIYNPDGKGGHVQFEITVDYDKLQMRSSDTDVMDFRFEDGNLIVEDLNSQIRFVMSKDN